MAKVNQNLGIPKLITQDNPEGRKWIWEEDGFTVYRGNARTGPGCHSNCGILLYVKDGVLEKIEGDLENPFNQGRLCPRCLSLNETLYHPDRLRYPLKRTGQRGENKWERVSWDEAYEFLETKLRSIIDKYGSESISIMQGTGRDINGYGSRLAFSLGSPNYIMALSGMSCLTPRKLATTFKLGEMIYGDYSQFFPERYENQGYEAPEYILIWGNNPVVANSDGMLGHWIVELMKRGTKLITIDPKLTWLASRSEYFLQVRPGTDSALALAFGHVICAENLYDQQFVRDWTYGFEDYKSRCAEYSPERVAEICGVPASLIRQAARAYATARRASLQWGAALDMTSDSLFTGMACVDLVALTGNLEKPGTMVTAFPCFDVKNTRYVGWGAELLPEEKAKLRMNGKYPILHMAEIPSPDMVVEAMISGLPYPIKAAWMQTTNPLANISADPVKMLQALQNMELNVVVDLFLTPTAMAVADIVLPAACYPERPGLVGHQPYYLGAIVQAIDPVGECRSDQQIIYEMSRRFQPDANPWRNDFALYDSILEHLGITYDDLKERTWAYPEFNYNKHEKGLLRPDGKPGFNTPTGKYEFKSTILEQLGFDPVVNYSEPLESPLSTPDLAKEYPLVLTTGARRNGLFHSEHRQIPSLRRLHPEPTVQIHPQTAACYGIKDGDWVWLENNHGKCKQKAELTPAIRPDVISADHGWWFPERGADDGTWGGVFESNINCLIPMTPGSTGIGTGFKAVLCKIYKDVN